MVIKGVLKSSCYVIKGSILLPRMNEKKKKMEKERTLGTEDQNLGYIFFLGDCNFLIYDQDIEFLHLLGVFLVCCSTAVGT